MQSAPLFGSVQQRFTGQIYNATALAYNINPVFIKGAVAGGLVMDQRKAGRGMLLPKRSASLRPLASTTVCGLRV